MTEPSHMEQVCETSCEVSMRLTKCCKQLAFYKTFIESSLYAASADGKEKRRDMLGHDNPIAFKPCIVRLRKVNEMTERSYFLY